MVGAFHLPALAMMHWSHIRYSRAFAGTWLVLAFAGALNALVEEWDDNAPGGFLNPKK
jgi:hypothetical protein